MTYLLDTDTCVYALKQNVSVLGRLLAHRRSEIAVSVITEAELRTGAAESSSPTKTRAKVENFLRPLTLIAFTSEDAITYSQIRTKLERAGTPIGPLDTLIAAQALGRGFTLVSNNDREFRRVSGLLRDNWTD